MPGVTANLLLGVLYPSCLPGVTFGVLAFLILPGVAHVLPGDFVCPGVFVNLLGVHDADLDLAGEERP